MTDGVWWFFLFWLPKYLSGQYHISSTDMVIPLAVLYSMTMVGSVVKHGQPYALLKVDNLLYQVKVGDYLGQNYGKITKITETDISLREIVQDAAGEWIERGASLQLQERAR